MDNEMPIFGQLSNKNDYLTQGYEHLGVSIFGRTPYIQGLFSGLDVLLIDYGCLNNFGINEYQLLAKNRDTAERAALRMASEGLNKISYSGIYSLLQLLQARLSDEDIGQALHGHYH